MKLSLSFLFIVLNVFVHAQDLLPFENTKAKWGYKNAAGQIKIAPKYDAAGYFNEGFAVVNIGGENGVNGKNGIINAAGKEVLVPTSKYDFIEFFVGGRAMVGYNSNGGKSKSEYGFINKAGKEINVIRFSEAHNFSEGFAAVKSEGKGWGYIDTTGKQIVPFKMKETARKIMELFC